MAYLCPVCTSPLHLHSSGNSYVCANLHQFDIARQGYLNLLPVQHKNSRQPGDNKEMLQARREFLEAGYYAPLANAIADLIEGYQVIPRNFLELLDVGCGEGYYSRYLTTALLGKVKLVAHGVDIAKPAIIAAAKKQPEGRFIVASAKRLPYLNEYFDCLLKIFAPASDPELWRVLKTAGLLISVTPGTHHLAQLKEFIYAEVKKHPLETDLPEGFAILHSERLYYSIIPSAAHRLALLQMTPFAWRISEQARQAMVEAQSLSMDIDFVITVAQKIAA